MELTLKVTKSGGEHLADVSVLKNGTTLVTYAFGSTCLHCELHELFQRLVEQHGEICVVARRRVG